MRKGSVKARPGEAALSHREKLRHLREILFANVVMAGEIPAPTGDERRITRFLSDRFTESGLANISLDQAGNVAGVLPGRNGVRHLLVAAHVDKIWAETDDHTVSVGVGRMSGRGIADNSLGVAVLATLPLILDELGVELESNLILLGTTRSFGRGDLGGMRFFLENAEHSVDAALCLEGIELGRLSYSSFGMARGEIEVLSPETAADERGEEAGLRVVAVLTGLLRRLLAIHEREHPRASVLVRSIESGSGDGVPARSGRVRFEIRSHEAVRVARVEEEIAALVAGADRSGALEIRGEMIARRSPGDLGADHPLVAKAREILGLLGIETHVAPSVSELALLLERGIPSLTLGITRGENRHSPAESIRLEPIFDGLAQIVAVLQFLDRAQSPDKHPMSEIDQRISRWLETNTFHHSEFWDMQELVRAKREAGLTISLCIPTLNEEKTIGKEIIVFKSELMDRYPLLDEIAVIDSGSSDRTLEVAASFGADTYLSSEILPQHGSKPGKGENLWKAIYQLRGDIICYVDADIKNIHPKFASALVAPLIYRPGIQYVKAFYDRPLAVSDDLRPSGGGRVTEILVRPLFSMFFPELTALIQPLSGEYAVRREVLERLPFPIGYGVETSHLIDLYQTSGLDAFAQTDLDNRIHRNQPTSDLGRMAFGILRSFMKRLRDYGMVGDLPELHGLFRQFQAGGHRHEQVSREILEEERPPMITLPEYRERHGR